MFRTGLFSLLVALCVSGSNGAEQRRAKSPGVPQYYQAFAAKEDRDRTTLARLHNGLTLVVEEQSILPLACLVTYLRTSPLEGNAAAAAFFYKFLVERVSSLPFEIGKLGGSFRVLVREDHLAMVSVVPPEEVSEALDIHARALSLKDLSPDQIESGILLFREVSRQRSVTIGRQDRRRLWEMAYPGRGGDRARLVFEGFSGQEETLGTADWQAFRRTFHRPDRVIVSVSGSVFRENVLRKSVELYSGFRPPQSSPETQSASGKFGATKGSFEYQSFREDRPGSSIRLGVRIPSSLHRDFYPILMLSTIVGKGRGSLLGRYALQAGLILDWEVELTPLSTGGLLDFNFEPHPEKLDAAEVELMSILRALGDKGPGAADLDRAKAILVREHYQRLETLEGRAYEKARWQALGGYAQFDEIPSRIQSVSAEQVREVAGRYFRESEYYLLESLASAGDARDFTKESYLETIRLLVPPRASKIGEEFESLASLQKESGFQAAEFTPRLIHYDLRKTSVLRGPDVYMEERHLVPVVHVGFFFPGGRLDEESGNAGITEVMLEAILQGVPNYENELVWLEFEKMGGIVEIVNEPDFFGYRVSVLSNHLDSVIRNFHRWLIPRGLSETEVSLARGRIAAQRAWRKADPEDDARSRIKERLFDGHSYSLDRRGSETSLGQLDVMAVWAWTRKQLEAFHPVIVIHGDAAGTSFLPALIPTLSHSRFKNKEKAPKSPGSDLPDAAWSSSPGFVEVGFRAPVLGSRDAWVLTALEKVLQLMQEKAEAGERLWQKASGTVLFAGQIYQNSGAFYVGTHVVPGTEEKAVSRLREGLERFSSTIIRREDFLGALVATITNFYQSQQDGHDSLLRLARDFLGGEKTDYRTEYLTTIKGLQLDEVRLLGVRLFKTSALEAPLKEEAQ